MNCLLLQVSGKAKRRDAATKTAHYFFKDDSETNLINRNAGIAPVTVSKETFGIIERAIKNSTVSQCI